MFSLDQNALLLYRILFAAVVLYISFYVIHSEIACVERKTNIAPKGVITPDIAVPPGAELELA